MDNIYSDSINTNWKLDLSTYRFIGFSLPQITINDKALDDMIIAKIIGNANETYFS